MNNSGFDFRNLKNTDKATGHTNIKKDITTVEDFDSTYAPGCGSIYTTVMDLYKLYKGLYTNLVIDSAIREQAFIPRQWKYGYGWFGYALYGRKCVSHAGGVPGFLSNLQFFPNKDLCVILLSNINDDDLVKRSDKLASFIFQMHYQSSGL